MTETVYITFIGLNMSFSFDAKSCLVIFSDNIFEGKYQMQPR